MINNMTHQELRKKVYTYLENQRLDYLCSLILALMNPSEVEYFYLQNVKGNE